MTNANQKAAIRKRMADTGENYTTAKRAIEQAREGARERAGSRDDGEMPSGEKLAAPQPADGQQETAP